MQLRINDTLIHKDSFSESCTSHVGFLMEILKKEISPMEKSEERFLTNAPKEKKLTIFSDQTFPNLKNTPGDSVDEYAELKTANGILAGEEIRQQNENL
jgi:hypothetical protein